MNYPSLTPPQVVVLTNQTNGTGYPLALGATNPYPSGNFAAVTPATVNLTDRGINDQVHSFTYTIIEPVKAVIEIGLDHAHPGPGKRLWGLGEHNWHKLFLRAGCDRHQRL